MDEKIIEYVCTQVQQVKETDSISGSFKKPLLSLTQPLQKL